MSVLTLAVIAIALVPPAGAAPDKRPPFRVRTGNHTIKTISVAVAKDETTREVTFGLYATGRTHTIEKIAATVPGLGTGVSVTVAGGDAKRTVKKDRSVRVILTVKELSNPGTYNGFLNATVDGQPTVIAPIVVAKAVAPKVTLKDKYDFTTGERTSTFGITVVNPTKVDLVQLTAQVQTMTGPSGQQVTPKLEPPAETLSIKAGEPALVKMTVDLAVAGTYTGLLEVRSIDGLLGSADLSIVRETGALPVTISPAGPFSDARSLTGDAGVPVSLHLVDTNGAERQVHITVQVRRRDDPKGQAAKAKLRTPDCNGEPVTATVGELKAQTVVGELCGVPGPGLYHATFTLSDHSRSPAVAESDIDVKRHWGVAFACFGFGVLCSAVIGWVWRHKRKGQVRRALASAEQHLTAADATLGAAAVVAAIRQHLSEFRNGKSKDVELAQLFDDQARLAVAFAALDRQVTVNGLKEPAKFASIRTALTTQPSTALTATLRTAESDLISSIAVVEAAMIALPTAQVVRAGTEQLRRDGSATDLTDVDAAATALDVAVESGNPAVVKDKARALDQAFSRVLADRLQQSIVTANLPAQFGPGLASNDEWVAVVEATNATVSSIRGVQLTSPMRTYQDAAVNVARVETAAVVRLINDRITKLPAPAPGAPADQEAAEFLKKLQAAAKLAEHAAAAAQGGDVRQAQALLRSANDAMPTVVRKESASSDSSAPTLANLDVDALHVPFVPPPIPPAIDLQVSTGPLEWIVGTTAAIVAILIGMQTIYATNASWGSTPDIVAAILFGLGLTGSAFAGLVPLKQSILTNSGAT